MAPTGQLRRARRTAAAAGLSAGTGHALAELVADRPVDGDVLITTKAGNHLISVIPHPHRLTFSSLPQALQLARKWARSHNVNIWHAVDGEIRLLTLDGQN